MTTLKAVIGWIISGGGAGVVAFFLMRRVKMRSDWKRYVSVALALLIACAFYALSVWMTYSPVPPTPQAWVERLSEVMLLALTSSQIIHGATDLRKRVKAERLASMLK